MRASLKSKRSPRPSPCLAAKNLGANRKFRFTPDENLGKVLPTDGQLMEVFVYV